MLGMPHVVEQSIDGGNGIALTGGELELLTLSQEQVRIVELEGNFVGLAAEFRKARELFVGGPAEGAKRDDESLNHGGGFVA